MSVETGMNGYPKAPHGLRRLGDAVAFPCAIFLSGVIVAAIYWTPAGVTSVSDLKWSTPIMGLGADPSRFLLQGSWLSKGFGFRETTETGLYCTSLPPGHPVFLALAMCLTDDMFWLRVIQAAMHAASGVVLYYAVRPFSWYWATVAGFLVSGSPWGASLATSYMSETTGTFLVCLTLYLGIAIFRSSGLLRGLGGEASNSTSAGNVSPVQLTPQTFSRSLPVAAFVLGMLCVTVCLTVPGVTISMLAFFVVSAHAIRKNRVGVLGLVLGASVVMGIWQLHCVRATGRPAYGLLHSLQPQFGKAWVRTWARSPDEYVLGVRVFVWPNDDPDYSAVPEYAFRDPVEKQEILDATERWRTVSGDSLHPTPEFETRSELLTVIAAREFKEHPLKCYVQLPLIRGIRSWTDLRPASYLQIEGPQYFSRLNPVSFMSDVKSLGIKKAIVRTFRGFLTLYALVMHVLGLLAFVFGLWYVIRHTSAHGALILLSVIVFTLLHGVDGPESRRNVPMVPIAVAVPVIASCFKSRNGSQPSIKRG